MSESKKSSAPFHFDASGWKKCIFHAVLYTIGKKLSPWKMKKSWKSPGILFSHFCTNPVLTLCLACCRWVVMSLNFFVPIHTTLMLTVCYINRQSGRGYHYSDTNACGESAASKKGHLKLIWITTRLTSLDICALTMFLKFNYYTK